MIDLATLPPAIVVRSLDDVRMAASVGLPLTMISPRGAALQAGALWWQALAREARLVADTLIGADILDCADASGRALEALRLGQIVIVLEPDAIAHVDVARRAAAMGATLLDRRPPALDLDIARRRRDVSRIADWLAGMPPPEPR